MCKRILVLLDDTQKIYNLIIAVKSDQEAYSPSSSHLKPFIQPPINHPPDFLIIQIPEIVENQRQIGA